MTTQASLSRNWQPLAPSAKVIGIHPESLRRKYRYGELPDGSVQKVGRILYFDIEKLKHMAGA